METITCPGCGQELSEPSNFCTCCGYDLRSNTYSTNNTADFIPESNPEIHTAFSGGSGLANNALKIIGILLLIIGVHSIPYIFSNISSWFTIVSYDGLFSLTLFRIFLYIIENLVSVIGFVAVAITLVSDKHIGYFRLALLPVLLIYAIRAFSYFILCIEWFHVYTLLYMIISLVLLVMWAAILFPAVVGNILPNGSQKVILTAIVGITFLISLILSSNYIYNTFWTSFVNFLEYVVLVALIWFNPQIVLED